MVDGYPVTFLPDPRGPLPLLHVKKEGLHLRPNRKGSIVWTPLVFILSFGPGPLGVSQ